mmetsp:Transcript_28375/g.76833  ORF Transcript_28375/g.76833 Transcript_28375/m.76833 type:complete len:260 (-) Transcript_28375:8-787(-)
MRSSDTHMRARAHRRKGLKALRRSPEGRFAPEKRAVPPRVARKDRAALHCPALLGPSPRCSHDEARGGGLEARRGVMTRAHGGGHLGLLHADALAILGDGVTALARTAIQHPEVAVVRGEVANGHALRLRTTTDLATVCLVLEGEGELVGELAVASLAGEVQLAAALREQGVVAVVVRIMPCLAFLAVHPCKHFVLNGLASRLADSDRGLGLRMDVGPGARARMGQRRAGREHGQCKADGHSLKVGRSERALRKLGRRS